MHKGYTSINPAFNKEFGHHAYISEEQLNQMIQKAADGYLIHRKRTFAERAALLMKLAGCLEKRADELAKMMAMEMGKPFVHSKAEIMKTAGHCKHFAANGEKMLANKPLTCSAKTAYVSYEPTGPLFLVMPWNFPIWLPLKCGVPNLMLGNTLLLKPSHVVPQSSLILEEIMKEAGYVNGEFQVALVGVDKIDRIVGDDRIAGVSLTGSTKAGKNIAAIAGKHVKRCVLELGGSDPFIVLHDADLKLAAKLGATSRLLNAGQVCIAAKRFIVDEKIYDQFMKELISETEKFTMGDPVKPETTLGPIATKDGLKSLKEQVKKTLSMGGHLVYGDAKQLEDTLGEPKDLFFKPMIIDNVPKGSPGENDEIFGPVFMMFKFKTEAEAVKLANDTRYGLGGAIMSKDVERAQNMAHEVETGSVFINELCKTDSRVPCGGTKESGHGRECNDEGIKEFANWKTIYVA